MVTDMRGYGFDCVLCLFVLASTFSGMGQANAQELRMRQRSGWDGSNSGRPSQPWVPGIEQQERKQQEDVLRGWQEAERQSAQTRMTPENVLRQMQAKIQRAHSLGDYGTEAAAWENLGQTLMYGGLAPYARGIDVWSCRKGEITARLGHVRQVQRVNVGTEMSEWSKIRPLAIQLSGHEPANAQWPFLEGIAYFKSGPGSFDIARQRLAKSMNTPGCPPEIKGSCALAISQMAAEEARLRALAKKQAEERAARAARERARAAEEAQASAEKDKFSRTLELAKDAIGKHQYQQAVTMLNQIIDARPRNCPDVLGSAYMFRAVLEKDEGQYQQAYDDCTRAQEAGRNDSLVQQIKREAQAQLRR